VVLHLAQFKWQPSGPPTSASDVVAQKPATQKTVAAFGMLKKMFVIFTISTAKLTLHWSQLLVDKQLLQQWPQCRSCKCEDRWIQKKMTTK